jgi:hypothetical protein
MSSVTPPTSGAKEPISKTVSFGDRVLDTKVLPYMRSRNVEFVAKRMRPLTQVFAFFNGVDVNKFIIPKLIEIRMTSGVFQVSETVVGSFDSPNLPTIRFRVAAQNHKYGNYDFPEDIFDTNPYNPNLTIPATYSSTSTILNVDTFSLSDRTSNFLGYIANGMKLRGSTSRAEAVVTDIKLITNDDGVVIGSFFIPDPNVDVNPVFETGTRPFRLTSSRNNSLVVGTYTSAAEENYSADGKVNMVQENVIVTRPVRVETNITQVINVIGGPGNPVDVPYDPGYIDFGGGGGGGYSIPDPPQPPTPQPMGGVVGTQPPPPQPPKTTVYYNFGTRELFPAGADRLKDLAKDAGLPKDIIRKIDSDLTKKQQDNIINKINKSPNFVANNLQVSTGNNMGSERTTVFGDSVVKTALNPNTTVGRGTAPSPMGSPGPSPMGADPGPSPMGSPGPSPMGSPGPSPATMGQPSFTPSNPSPAPSPRPSPPPSPPPSPRPSPPPAPSRAPSPPSGGGGMGGMSDIRLKKNIVSINSALSKLMNIALFIK